MSRFGYDGDGYEYQELDWGRWQQNEYLTFNGKPGRKALADLEAALVALPSKRLIESSICKSGEVCAVGAFAAHKTAQAEGIDIGTAIARLASELELVAQLAGDDGWGWESADQTAKLGQRHGMSYTMAYVIGEMNDERFGGHSPEERYRQLLDWVRSKLAEPPKPIIRRSKAEREAERQRKAAERRAARIAAVSARRSPGQIGLGMP